MADKAKASDLLYRVVGEPRRLSGDTKDVLYYDVEWSLKGGGLQHQHTIDLPVKPKRLGKEDGYKLTGEWETETVPDGDPVGVIKDQISIEASVPEENRLEVVHRKAAAKKNGIAKALGLIIDV
jgi:hypothetical protein